MNPPLDGNPCFPVQLWSMATASTIAPVRRSSRSPMPYTPYTLNSSAVPYGLWIDIPFRKRGSTQIRSEAKGRGARFCPAAKGAIKWWMPKNRLTADTVNWLNSHEMIRGERKAPVFNPNAMKLSDIDLAHRFRLFLAVPFENKDETKAMGALWSAEDKRWFFDATSITQQRFDEMLKRQWVYSFHGVLKSDPTHTATGVYFSTEDLGSPAGAAAPKAPAVPHKPQAWTFVKNGMFLTMHTTPTDVAEGIVLTSDDENYADGIYTKEKARNIWNALIADGWVMSQTHGAEQ